MTDREQLLIEKLGLRHLNLEAGNFAFIRESDIEVRSDNQSLAASNLIYLMLNKVEPVNYVQRLESDDYQVLIEGGPADYYLFYPDGETEMITLGRDLEKGEQMVVAAPGGTAKAIVLHDGADYMLAASVVTPAWTPTRVEIGVDDAFLARYAGTSDWATEARIRELAGPNYGHIAGGQPDELALHLDESGQVIFLGMQLSEGQAAKEIQRFAESHAGQAGSLTIHAGASKAAAARIEQLVRVSDINFEVTYL